MYVIASEDATSVEISGRETVKLNAGQKYQAVIGSDEYMAIMADKPVIVAQVTIDH